MLSAPHVMAALEATQDAFAAYRLETSEAYRQLRAALSVYERQSAEQILRAVDGIVSPGALPTAERVAGRSLVQPFREHWTSHEAARRWAMDVLNGVPTVAVDGSQITPAGEFSVPIGAVQVGWFVNPHRPGERYIKDLAFEILPPDQLHPGDDPAGRGFPDLQVNLRRFERECQELQRLMASLADAGSRALCLLDGSLIVSFAGQMRPELRTRYVSAVTRLIDTSEETRVPLVGYIDSSHARDVVSLLEHLHFTAVGARLPDSALLRDTMRWGDRSEVWTCARRDAVFEDHPEDSYYGRVCFFYLKTTAEGGPSRLDMPSWVVGAGLLDWVADVVRAECIVGLGYPYAIETADAVAVITMEDRAEFYRLCQAFLERHGVPLRHSRKAASKRTRR